MAEFDISKVKIRAKVSISHKIRFDIDKSALATDIHDVLDKYRLNQEGVIVKVGIEDEEGVMRDDA